MESRVKQLTAVIETLGKDGVRHRPDLQALLGPEVCHMWNVQSHEEAVEHTSNALAIAIAEYAETTHPQRDNRLGVGFALLTAFAISGFPALDNLPDLNARFAKARELPDTPNRVVPRKGYRLGEKTARRYRKEFAPWFARQLDSKLPSVAEVDHASISKAARGVSSDPIRHMNLYAELEILRSFGLVGLRAGRAVGLNEICLLADDYAVRRGLALRLFDAVERFFRDGLAAFDVTEVHHEQANLICQLFLGDSDGAEGSAALLLKAGFRSGADPIWRTAKDRAFYDFAQFLSTWQGSQEIRSEASEEVNLNDHGGDLTSAMTAAEISFKRKVSEQEDKVEKAVAELAKLYDDENNPKLKKIRLDFVIKSQKMQIRLTKAGLIILLAAASVLSTANRVLHNESLESVPLRREILVNQTIEPTADDNVEHGEPRSSNPPERLPDALAVAIESHQQAQVKRARIADMQQGRSASQPGNSPIYEALIREYGGRGNLGSDESWMQEEPEI